MQKHFFTSKEFQSLAFNISLSLALGATFSTFLVQLTRNVSSASILLAGFMTSTGLESSAEVENHINSVVAAANEHDNQSIPFSRVLFTLASLFLISLILTVSSDRLRVFQKFRPLPPKLQELIKGKLGAEYVNFEFGKSDFFPVVRFGRRQISLPPSVVLGASRADSHALSIIDHERTHAFAADPFFGMLFRAFRIALFLPLFFLGLGCVVAPLILLEFANVYSGEGYIDDVLTIIGMIAVIVLVVKFLNIQRKNYYDAKEEFANDVATIERKNGTRVVLAAGFQCILYTTLIGPPSFLLAVVCFFCLLYALLVVAPPSLRQITVFVTLAGLFTAFTVALFLIDDALFKPMSQILDTLPEVMPVTFFPIAILLLTVSAAVFKVRG